MPLNPTPPPLGSSGWSPGHRQPAPDSADRACSRDVSPLGVARTAFELLTAGPSPLALDTRDCPGLPDRPVPLDELRSRLLTASCPAATRDVVWRRLVTRSRTEGAAWTVACVGLALPALLRMSADMSERFAGDPSDVHAEILTAFLTALATLDLDRPGVMTRLRWAAYRGGHAALREALAAPMPCGDGYRSTEPPAPAGHPDLVLARAVAEAVITTVEADLIGATRLERHRMRDWASEHYLSYEAARKIRQRGERRLVDWLRDQARTNDGDEDGGRSVRRGNPPRWTSTAARTAGSAGGAGLRLVSPRAVPGTGSREAPTGTTRTPGVGDGVAGRVSPIRAGSGFQGCGTTLHPTSHPNASSEDPRCA
ncbi:MAG: hypothetical protein M3Y89_13885 [Actinomycetota bacterium]|nr:hypothetical protein [Actinomycetota bacterium]